MRVEVDAMQRHAVGGAAFGVGVGEHVRADVVAPFATTEGALVASATRGALAVSRATSATELNRPPIASKALRIVSALVWKDKLPT